MDIIIRKEEDAWHWLQQALDGKLPEDEPISLKFDGWPILELKFKGNDFDQSVPTRIMPPLLVAQQEMNRAYCALRYGTTSTRKLKDDEREQLELNVRVKKGSSEYDTNLTEVLNRTFEAAIDKMEPNHVLIAVLGIAVSWAGSTMWKSWLNHRLDKRSKELEAETGQRLSDERLQMSQLEYEKLKLMSRAHREVPATKEISEGADDFRNNSLHRLKESDHFELPNSEVSVDGYTAASITTEPRERSVEIRIDGEFVIQAVSSGEASGFKLKVKRTLDGKIINVAISDGTLTDKERDILSKNEWAKRPVLLQINAKELRGEITSATLVKASKIERQPME